MVKGNSDKAKFIDSLIPEPLKPYLKDGRYMCVGGTLFQASAKKSGNGYELDFIEISKDYLKETQDSNYPKDVYYSYSYDSDTPMPCNIRGQFEFVANGTLWNAYNYPPHDYIDVVGEDELAIKCKNTMQLFEHIYRDDLTLGLDYATVEFMNPEQKLPVQVLFSKDNKTAKSTILNQRKWMYGSNGTVIDSATFEDKFNSPVIGKNFVGIDEGKLKNEDSMEKIKMRVTSATIQFRAMRKSAKEVPNFSKWFLATNKENFAKLDEEDSRFWIIQCYKLDSAYDPKFEDKLKAEVPYWIGFLKRRWENRFDESVTGKFKMNNPKSKDRLWFLEKQYTTNTLARVKRFSKSKACKELVGEIIEWFQHYNNGVSTAEYKVEIKTAYATAKILRTFLTDLDNRISAVDIKRILENEVGLSVCMDDGGIIENKTFPYYFIEQVAPAVPTDRKRNVFKLEYEKLVKFFDGEDFSTDILVDAEQQTIKH